MIQSNENFFWYLKILSPYDLKSYPKHLFPLCFGFLEPNDGFGKNEKLDKNLLRFLTVKVKDFDLDTNYFSKDDKTNEK